MFFNENCTLLLIGLWKNVKLKKKIIKFKKALVLPYLIYIKNTDAYEEALKVLI